MKKIIELASVITCILIMLSFTACSDNKPEAPVVSSPDTSVVSESVLPGITETDSQPAEGKNASPVIQSAVTDDVHFARFDTFLVFGSDEIEDYVMWCDMEMVDFYITNIYYDENGWITDGKHLFDAKTVPVGTAINYLRMVPEGFPTDAVIYTANGKTYMYAVGYNGRDGGISFMEIDKLIVDPDYTSPTFDEPEASDSTEVLIEVYWVSDNLEIFALEYTIESDSKWHVWKALKAQNKQIPSKCSLKSGEMVTGRNGVMELDFSKELMDIGSSMKGRPTLQAIANTYISAYDLQAVCFMVEGEYLESAICGYAEEFAYTDC